MRGLFGASCAAAQQRGQRLLEVAELFLDEAEDEVGVREVRIELDRLVAVGQRAFVVAPVVMNRRDLAGDDRRDRIERVREQHFVARFVEAARAAPGSSARTSDGRSRSRDRA